MNESFINICFGGVRDEGLFEDKEEESNQIIRSTALEKGYFKA